MPIANVGIQVRLNHAQQCQNKAIKTPANSDLNDDLLLTRQPGEVGGDADIIDKIIWHILFY